MSDEVKTDTCNCNLCQKGRTLRRIASTLSPDDSAWLRNFGVEFLHVSSDEEYYRSIVQGDWPNAVEILERELDRARTMAGDK